MKRVYMSVEEGFEKTPETLYRSSKRIIHKLAKKTDLFLVHPGDYSLENGTILAAYSWDGKELHKTIAEHVPEGDMFIIYGDETSKANFGIEFANNQYHFLKNLQLANKFNYFLNTPQAEGKTLKTELEELCKDGSLMIAKTEMAKNAENVHAFLNEYGSAIIKPTFGCRSTGVFKLESLDDLKNLNLSSSDLQSAYVIQEPLSGDEKRIVLLDGELLCSRVHKDRKTPWGQDNAQKTFVYHPREGELDISKRLANLIGADIIGVDFIGTKVNEVNGTGTGIIIKNHEGRTLYDKTDDFVNFVMGKLE